MLSYVFNQIPLALRNEGHSKIFVAHKNIDAHKADFRSAVHRAFEPELTPYYADRELSPGYHLLTKLAQRIEVSRIFVCDLSFPSANVMLEAGIALGRNKPILFCAHDNAIVPTVLQDLNIVRYSDYRQLGTILENQKHRNVATAISGKDIDWCQLCQQKCLAKYGPVPSQERGFIVDNTISGQHRQDFEDVLTRSLNAIGLKVHTMEDAREVTMRTLCSYVRLTLMSRLGFYRFTHDTRGIIPFLFGLSYGLETHPLIVTDRPDGLPSDLAGYDRVEYKSFEQLGTEIRDKIPQVLRSVRAFETPSRWLSYDSKTQEALTQINTLVLQSLEQIDSESDDYYENFLEMTLALAVYALRTSAGSLMLRTPQDTLRIVAMVAPKIQLDAVGEWREFNMNEGIAGWVASTSESYLTGNVQEDLHYEKKTFDRNLFSLVCVPVVHDEHVLGVINADSREPEFFRRGDIEILSQVAQLIAPVIHGHMNALEHANGDNPTSNASHVRNQLMASAVCLNCGDDNTFLSFLRLDDERGLRYRMVLKCERCGHSEEIRTYMLHST